MEMLINAVKALGGETVISLLDQDQAGREATLRRLLPGLAGQFHVMVGDWDEKYKGPDDLLKAGQRWQEIPGDQAVDLLTARLNRPALPAENVRVSHAPAVQLYDGLTLWKTSWVPSASNTCR